MKTKGVVLGVVVLLMMLFAIEAEAVQGFIPTKFALSRLAQTKNFTPGRGGNLLYYGGPVISQVKVYAVFWGDNVNAETQSGISNYLSAVAKSDHLDWLDQYGTFLNAVDGRAGTQQHIGRGEFVSAITIQPNNTNKKIDDNDIQAELQKQIDDGKLPKPDDNTLFMTYFPAGMKITAFGLTSCQDFCAYHGFKGTPETDHFYFGVMPDIGGACSWGCGFASTHFDSVASISSHELVEAVTDPFPTPGDKPAYPQAWNDTQGSEIADICVSGGTNALTTSAGDNYVVQSEWDNSTQSCTKRGWSSP